MGDQKQWAAGRIVNDALKHVISKCKAEAKLLDLCREGDNYIEEHCKQIYTKKVDGEPIQRGIAYPTCISVNDCIRNDCPLEDDTRTLKDGDIVRIELGAHIDGYIATAAHTIVVGNGPITGRAADALQAAWTAYEAASRLIQVGVSNTELSNIINKAVSEFECNFVTSTVSNELRQHVIDGVKCVLPRPGPDEKQPPCTFQPEESYAINIFVSSGEGKKPKEGEDRPTVYKREVSVTALPKSSAGRTLIEEVNTKFPCLPFAARSVGEPKTRRMALTEAVRTRTLMAIPTLYQKQSDEVVAHFGFTIQLLAKKAKRCAGLDELMYKVESPHSVKDEELVKLLAKPIS